MSERRPGPTAMSAGAMRHAPADALVHDIAERKINFLIDKRRSNLHSHRGLMFRSMR